MSGAVDVPEDAVKALVEVLQKHYPELEASDEIHRSISYARSKSPNSSYQAEVIYFSQHNSLHALFEFTEQLEKHHGYVRRWTCRHDWRD